MKDVIDALRKKEAEEKLPAIRLEIDYQLVTLFDAMQDENQQEIAAAKAILKKLQLQKTELESSR